MKCPRCKTQNPNTSKFCCECGERLAASDALAVPGKGERKQVTVLFSDLSGYTAMSEKLDAEEVKEIMSRIFAEASGIITKYGGQVDKLIGDAVMALFGVPRAHEDDAVRAIRAAVEIHNRVNQMSFPAESCINGHLCMHAGINTGLVVTSEISPEEETEKVLGDSVNLASRLTSLARAGEICVGEETYRQAERYFNFEVLELSRVKGKEMPIRAYKVLSPREELVTIHRLSGLRAELIGRAAEMSRLKAALEKLRNGIGSIVCVCGEAGTGKSRLVAEFRAGLGHQNIQWREGCSYAYSQNIPYSTLKDFLNRAWQVEESDSLEQVREKVETNVGHLLGKEEFAPFIGSLYGIRYKELEDIDPEFWKRRIKEAAKQILKALVEADPTVIYLEDIHWADPSSLDLFRFLLSEFSSPALFLCAYRPPFSLFEEKGLKKPFELIELKDLSLTEAQHMMESLLKTDSIPAELKRFIQEKAEGNPFYLEEAVNSLIELEALVRDNGSWKLTRPLSESTIPLTINGVISARVDRLEAEMKRILQEASVIGRVFLYEILAKITELKAQIDRYLKDLESLDLIRTRSLQPDLEYIFKHALTQDVVYGGLLKKERQEIHERIGQVMEELFQDRLPEFYETLAFHFKQGKSLHRAVDYLMKSGEKSLSRYAVEESDRYYREAYGLLSAKQGTTREDNLLLIDLIIKWAQVFYCRGDFKGLEQLLEEHKKLAESLGDKAKLGMFYSWLGMTLWGRENSRDSYHYLRRALELGEEIGDQKVIGYACAWISFSAAELDLLEEAVAYGERGLHISGLFEYDQYLHHKSLTAMAFAHWYRGDKKRARWCGEQLLAYGRRHANTRALICGHCAIGHGLFIDGDFRSAVDCYVNAVEVSADPRHSWYSQFPRLWVGMSYVSNGQFQEAEEYLREIAVFSEEFGTRIVGTPAQLFLGVVLIAKGEMARGFQMIEAVNQRNLENGRKFVYSVGEFVFGEFFSQIARGVAPVTLATVAKNLGFIVKNVPFAARKAEYHFGKAIEVGREIGAKGVVAQSHLGLGILHKAKGRKDKAWEYLSKAVEIFEQCGAETFLKQAREALESLDISAKRSNS